MIAAAFIRAGLWLVFAIGVLVAAQLVLSVERETRTNPGARRGAENFGRAIVLAVVLWCMRWLWLRL